MKTGKYAIFDDGGRKSGSLLLAILKERLQEAVKNQAELMVTAVKAELEGSKTGKSRIVNGYEHIASAAGEAPASETGKLEKSIQARFSIDGLIAEVGSFDTAYAPVLEYGIGMEARPFLQPVADRFEDEMRVTTMLILKETLT